MTKNTQVSKASTSLDKNVPTRTSKKSITIVIPSDRDNVEEEGSNTESKNSEWDTGDSSENNLNNCFPPFTRQQHTPVLPILNTPANPNRRLPDRLLAMFLRTRKLSKIQG
ncbi:hypothetical protein BDD12DRAFT_903734 [Trichophaea hybrida]|nr:hypothetical protein BDD12DRAFT_903734 [Trichophaea hybrida]